MVNGERWLWVLLGEGMIKSSFKTVDYIYSDSTESTVMAGYITCTGQWCVVASPFTSRPECAPNRHAHSYVCWYVTHEIVKSFDQIRKDDNLRSSILPHTDWLIDLLTNWPSVSNSQTVLQRLALSRLPFPRLSLPLSALCSLLSLSLSLSISLSLHTENALRLTS